jgi:putative transposase
MRFAFIKGWRTVSQIEAMSRLMEVTSRGFREWVKRPDSARARSDERVLAHIKDQFELSEKSYGRPRMTAELKEIGLEVGNK